MSVQQFSLRSLEDLDGGKAFAAFQLHLKRAAIDCMDRPADGKPRAVQLKIAFVPVLESDGTCNEVKAQVFATSTVPTHRTKVYSFGLRKNGVLVFNEDSLESIDQTTMFEDDK
jgi:hypothetical protein